jgi:hypothetical protein
VDYRWAQAVSPAFLIVLIQETLKKTLILPKINPEKILKTKK